jgi:hypothetical protein
METFTTSNSDRHPTDLAMLRGARLVTASPGDGTPGPERPKGVPNKATVLLKDAVFKAAETAGGGEPDGLVNYLVAQVWPEH